MSIERNDPKVTSSHEKNGEADPVDRLVCSREEVGKVNAVFVSASSVAVGKKKVKTLIREDRGFT